MYKDRIALYQELEAMRGSKVLVYVTGDRRGLEAQMHPEVLDFVADHLERVSRPNKISLFLYSRGGNTLAGWSLANLLRQYSQRFEVIVPAKAHSAATLVCLGAQAIVMTKQATLGPIDPSVNGPLNPRATGASTGSTVPVSVEDVAGFLDLARKELGIKDQTQLMALMTKFTDHVHPLSLGKVYRARMQIQQLAEKLLSWHWIGSAQKKARLISVLCTESGSHDYTINSTEAKDKLGLPVKTASNDLARLIYKIYVDIREELQLLNPFDPVVLLGVNQQVSYSCKQALVESATGGSHCFVKEGIVTKNGSSTQEGSHQPQNHVTFHGWRHEEAQLSV